MHFGFLSTEPPTYAHDIWVLFHDDRSWTLLQVQHWYLFCHWLCRYFILFIFWTGCNKASTPDFWRMVWEECSHRIVMVTNLVEKGKVRCFRV